MGSRNAKLDDSGPRSETARAHRRSVERAIIAMHEHLEEELSLRDMADFGFMSPYHFNRVFHRVTGIPPGRFFTALRLEAAKRHLLTSDESVTDICFAVGYNSLGTFTRRFKELVGLPPQRFRELGVSGVRPVLEHLKSCAEAARRSTPPQREGVNGRVRAPQYFSGPIFIGLFPTAIPQSRPAACTILAGPGKFQLAKVPDGRYYLFSAALSWSLEPTDYMLYEDILRGSVMGRGLAVKGGRVDGNTDITLRPPKLTDPPILMTFPLLIAERMKSPAEGEESTPRPVQVVVPDGVAVPAGSAVSGG